MCQGLSDGDVCVWRQEVLTGPGVEERDVHYNVNSETDWLEKQLG